MIIYILYSSKEHPGPAAAMHELKDICDLDKDQVTFMTLTLLLCPVCSDLSNNQISRVADDSFAGLRALTSL